MDYKFTFDDGSSAYLAHHGVKGMKWGVWNSETRARYSGGKGRSRGKMSDAEKAKLKKALAVGIGTAAAAVAVAAGVRAVATAFGGPVAGVVAGRAAGTATRMFSNTLAESYGISASVFDVVPTNSAVSNGINQINELLNQSNPVSRKR